ncbi:hypothetical protein [Yokenella regensburgei]|uniref:hypothetical protein n=1 Tax=Yokenella regensburgei TaxID=158877 RepID=UPI00137622CC|nr:hypothetical protein [Yokenella regensburgei]KAF1366264.1 hypothetical protein FHR25_005264 [Yokenella regensburgei]
MTNYTKLGEYIAYQRQFEDASTRRRDMLAMLENRALAARMSAETRINADELIALVKDAVSAENEMRAALDIANKAAPLCGEPEIQLNPHHHSVTSW